MYHKHHTRGIIMASQMSGDSSKRLDIFTERFGLINARAQGARNTRSKLRYSLQDFSFGEFSLVHGRNGWKVVSTRAEKNFFETFKNSPTKLSMAANILNLIKKLVSEEEAHTPVFNIVINFFFFLETAKNKDVAPAECLILLRILHSLGYMRHDPEFSVPISSSEIEPEVLETLIPKRSAMVRLINESLKAI